VPMGGKDHKKKRNLKGEDEMQEGHTEQHGEGKLGLITGYGWHRKGHKKRVGERE